MVIVAPDRQGHGIGKALMADLLREIGNRAILLNATTAGAPLYTALDAAAFGAPREAALREVLAAGRAMVIERAGAVAGFAASRPFGRGVVNGPVVARDEADACALVTALATPGEFVRVDVVGEAPSLVRMLTAAGLSCVDRVTPLRRGAWPKPGAARRFSLISQALG